jgi:hypothetical protein
LCLSARNSEKRIGKRVGYVQQTLAWLGTPDCPVRQAGRHETGLSGGAPDCPVCHSTEGKDSLPC